MTRTARVTFAVAMLLGLSLAPGAFAQRSRKAKPRVLLIGDSICTYYTPFVKRAVGAKAQVRRSGHAAHTRYGLENLDKWLGKNPPDVIHFNWGLHDLKNRGTKVPVEEYEKNLTRLVHRLKATRAKLVFATTTPVGPEAARRNSDVIQYNEAAVRVMKKEDIRVNDLYAILHPQRRKIQTGDGVHFTKTGNRIIGEAVGAHILELLKTEDDEKK